MLLCMIDKYDPLTFVVGCYIQEGINVDAISSIAFLAGITLYKKYFSVGPHEMSLYEAISCPESDR